MSAIRVSATVAVVTAVLVLVAAAPASPLTRAPANMTAEPSAQVFPPTARPYGQGYSEWAADWWEWALAQPTSTNPVLDTTGAHCAVGQTGHVWFLAGSFGNDPITRSCTVPAGTALLFPVLNLGFFAFLNDSPAERTETFIRSKVNPFVQAATGLKASIDGASVAEIPRYYEQSQVFSVVLPTDNVFGLTPAVAPGLVLDPSVDAGYYLMTRPLSPGKHTIHFEGSMPTLPAPTHIDVTYTITIRR